MNNTTNNISNPSGAPVDPTQTEIERIQEESTLQPFQMQIALLDACGVKPAAIQARFGLGSQYVYNIRFQNSEYRRVVMEFRRLISRKIVEEVSDIDELFNRQIEPSAATLIEVRDNTWAKDGDRIKAALAILDRAPKAPKATQQVESRSLSVQIPISAMKEMKGVLSETGLREDRELIELIEGSGVEEVKEAPVEAEEASNYDFIEVRRM